MDKTLCDEFAKDRGRNPLTGRRIQPGGPTHTKLLRFCAQHTSLSSGGRVPIRTKSPSPNLKPKSGGTTSECEKFLREPTRNPRTNRPIKIGGAVHASLVRKCAGKGVVAPLIRPAPPKPPRPSTSVVQTRNISCQKIGLRQMSGSCWFNSSLNGFILGGRSRKIFEALARADRSPRQTRLSIFGLFSCPRVPTKSHVFSYVRKVLDDRLERTPGGKYQKNHAASLAVRLGHTPARLVKGGGDPARAMRSILSTVFDTSAYKICSSAAEVQTISDPKVLIAAVASKPGMHYAFGLPLPLDAGNFSLDHVVMNVNFVKPDGSPMGHAVVGFRCGGNMYVYDSNRMKLMKFDWAKVNARGDGRALWNLLSRGGQYVGRYASAVVPYACYVRRVIA